MSTAEDADGGRNTNVEQAVAAALERIDEFVAGDELSPLPAPLREACDRLLDKQPNHATPKRARRRWYELVSVPTMRRD